MEKEADIAPGAGVRPGIEELLAESAHNRPAHFNHHVMPGVTIFATDIHATRKGDIAVDDCGLDMIAGQPRILDLPHVNVRVRFQE